jgi:hypothetical protein
LTTFGCLISQYGNDNNYNDNDPAINTELPTSTTAGDDDEANFADVMVKGL